MSDAIDRVEEWLRQYGLRRDADDLINMTHTDPSADMARLTTGDLREVLEMAYHYKELLR